MKKVIVAAVLLTLSGSVFAQKYMTRTGRISFDATSPKSPEEIKGINNEVASILDAATGNFVFEAPVKSFKFEKELMKDHFNENYMESDKFPKSQFNGKISNVSAVNFSKDGTYPTTVSGKLTIHGVAQDVSVPGTIVVSGKDVTAKAKFKIVLEKYGIKVPGVVADKLAKEAEIVVDSRLTQK